MQQPTTSNKRGELLYFALYNYFFHVEDDERRTVQYCTSMPHLSNVSSFLQNKSSDATN